MKKKRKNSLASNGNIVDLEKGELKKALSKKIHLFLISIIDITFQI